MKKLLLLLMFLSFPIAALAQGVRHDGQAIANVNTAVGQVARPIASALVTVCVGTTTPLSGACSLPTTIYSDIALSQPKANPFNADINGNYFFFGNSAANYVVSVGGVGLTTYSYVWTAPLSLAANSVFTGNSTFKSSIPWVDVAAYGAVGDTITDDTVAIQAAMDAAGAIACVRFNSKTYRTTTILQVNSGQCMSGDGSQKTLISNTLTTCFAKKSASTSVFDVYLSGIGCRDANTGASTTIGFDLGGFSRSEFHDLDVWYKLTGYQWKRATGPTENYYNKSFHLKANDTKNCMVFDTTFSVNQNDFYATECRRLAGTWDAGGGEIGINVSGNGNHFYGTYIGASGASSTALKFTTPANQNAFYGLYTESLPTIDVDATGVASPNYVDGLLSDGRSAPLITDPNGNLFYRTDNATSTVGGVTGQPALRWPRSTNANGSGTGTGIAYSALYPPSSTADPTSPTPLAGAWAYRSDLSRLRWFDTTWHSVPGLDTTDALTNKTVDCTLNTLAKTPCVVYSTVSASTNIGIAATTMATAGAGGNTYRLSAYFDQTVLGVACTGNSTINFHLLFTDPNAAASVDDILAGSEIQTGLYASNFVITTNGAVGRDIGSISIVIRAKASTVVQYRTAYSTGAGCAPAPSYQVYPILEQIN